MKGKIIILFSLFLGFSLTPVFALTPNESIHFDDSDNANILFMGSKKITNQENPSYSLNGLDDFLILESNLPEKLSDFTISVWVKPDYKIGTPAKMSIASNSNSFNLVINNDGVGKNVAMFSIYDGIKWQVVQSKTAIPQEWTQITATYSGKIIKIFVNGAQEGSVRIDKNYSLTHQYGVPNQNSNDFIYSNSNFLIGAFDASLRSDEKIKNHFSGQIDDLLLYGQIISKDQIYSIYQNGRTPYKPIIQNIKQSISNPIGVTNNYGFVTDPNNPNDHNIEELSYIGYKIKKSHPDKSSSSISHSISNSNSKKSDDNSLSSQINKIKLKLQEESSDKSKNGNDTETKLNVEDSLNIEEKSNNETIVICHISNNGDQVSLKFIGYTDTLFRYLEQGATLGKCSE